MLNYRTGAAVEGVRGLRIAPSGPIGIELEQHIRMLDLARRRLAFADHLRQRRPLLFGEPHNMFDHRESILIINLKKCSYDDVYASLEETGY
jgi:hypothetical protein